LRTYHVLCDSLDRGDWHRRRTMPSPETKIHQEVERSFLDEAQSARGRGNRSGEKIEPRTLSALRIVAPTG
jgi:hypothetical protein